MPLTTQHRTALFEALAPLAGQEATEALLSDHPTTEGDELVTKQFLRAELAELRTELRTELHERLAAQTRWMVATMLTSVGLSLAVARMA